MSSVNKQTTYDEGNKLAMLASWACGTQDSPSQGGLETPCSQVKFKLEQGSWF